jgi:hypothetical protein
MKEDFLIQCEADCERVAAVLVKWLKDENKEMLARTHTISSPNEMWAMMFESIYADEVVTHDLQETASTNVIQLTFQVERINNPMDDPFSDLSDDELLDALGEFLADRDDDDDTDEEDEDKTDD